MNRKTICINPNSNIIFTNFENSIIETELPPDINQVVIDSVKCKFCNKIYSRNDSLTRHLNNNSCKVKNEIIPNSIIESLKIKDNYPINNQLIDIIIDKTKAIEELKS